jgi:hypothetical protein
MVELREDEASTPMPNPRSGWPYLGAAVVTAWVLAVSWRWHSFIHPDWKIARAAAHTLTSSRALDTYSLHPRAQMGPAALLLALLPHDLYVVLVALLAFPVLLCSILAAPHDVAGSPRRWLTPAVAGAAVIVPWSQLAWKGHADDALVLLGAALMLYAYRARRPWLNLSGLLIAMAGKPTALVLLPLLGLGGSAVLAAGFAGTAVIWGPFLLADPHGLLAAGRGVMPVGHGSAPNLLGYRPGSPIPTWVRPLQLGAGLLAAAWGRVRNLPAEGVVIALAVRALLDTNPAPAYSIPLVVLAVFCDLQRTWPLLTVLASVGFWLSQPVLDGGPGWPRLAALLLLILTASFQVLIRSRQGQPDG